MKNNIKVFRSEQQYLTDKEKQELNIFVLNLLQKYTDAEHRFFDLLFKDSDQEDLTLDQAKDFITYLSRLRGFQLGIIPEDQVGENPLPWIDYILSGSSHTNFFENRVADYSHDGLQGEADYSKFVAGLLEKKMEVI